MTDPSVASYTAGSVAVCIPTAHRPAAVARLIGALAEQELRPAVVLVVDGSDDDRTRRSCEDRSGKIDGMCVRYSRSPRGLTLQRREGIRLLRENEKIRYICMLDDDVVLDSMFLSRAVGFLESPEGRPYGGVSAYDTLGWGRPFERRVRVYTKLGLLGRDVRPGRWLYCGKFIELSRLPPLEGVYDSDFIGGGLTVWRADVFDHFLPPQSLQGYALLEDKHLSLRVGTCYRLGVVGTARVRHERAPGARASRRRMAFTQVRREALLLRDCDPSPTWRRYGAFLSFTILDLAVATIMTLIRIRIDQVPTLFGSFAGWLSCVFSPPGPSEDALVRRHEHPFREAVGRAMRRG
jgi:glycosyltransferase involved in cell wall biosynthesis